MRPRLWSEILSGSGYFFLPFLTFLAFLAGFFFDLQPHFAHMVLPSCQPSDPGPKGLRP